jgi:hypothetical protein
VGIACKAIGGAAGSACTTSCYRRRRCAPLRDKIDALCKYDSLQVRGSGAATGIMALTA